MEATLSDVVEVTEELSFKLGNIIFKLSTDTDKESVPMLIAQLNIKSEMRDWTGLFKISLTLRIQVSNILGFVDTFSIYVLISSLRSSEARVTIQFTDSLSQWANGSLGTSFRANKDPKRPLAFQQASALGYHH